MIDTCNRLVKHAYRGCPSLMPAWLDLLLWVKSALALLLVSGSEMVARKTVWLFFLIGLKGCFMTLVLWGGIPEELDKIKVCFHHMSCDCQSEHFTFELKN